MSKVILWTCAHCGKPIYSGDTARVYSGAVRKYFFHYGVDKDCMMDWKRNRKEVPIEAVAELGTQ